MWILGLKGLTYINKNNVLSFLVNKRKMKLSCVSVFLEYAKILKVKSRSHPP